MRVDGFAGCGCLTGKFVNLDGSVIAADYQLVTRVVQLVKVQTGDGRIALCGWTEDPLDGRAGSAPADESNATATSAEDDPLAAGSAVGVEQLDHRRNAI